MYCHAISFVRVGAKQQHTSGSVKMLWLKWDDFDGWELFLSKSSIWWHSWAQFSTAQERIRCQWKAGDVKRSISIWGKKKWVDWEKSEYFENVEGNRLPRIFVSTVIPRRATDFDVDFNWITLWHYVAQAVLKVNFRQFLKYLCLHSRRQWPA